MKSIDRLYIFLNEKGIRPTVLEKKLGISNGYFSAQKKRNADMGESILNKVIDYFQDLNPIWLLNGGDDMFKRNASNLSMSVGDNNQQVNVGSSNVVNESNSPYSKNTKTKDQKFEALKIENILLKSENEHLKEKIVLLEKTIDSNQSIINSLLNK